MKSAIGAQKGRKERKMGANVCALALFALLSAKRAQKWRIKGAKERKRGAKGAQKERKLCLALKYNFAPLLRPLSFRAQEERNKSATSAPFEILLRPFCALFAPFLF